MSLPVSYLPSSVLDFPAAPEQLHGYSTGNNSVTELGRETAATIGITMATTSRSHSLEEAYTSGFRKTHVPGNVYDIEE